MTCLLPLTVPEIKRLVNLLTRNQHGLQHHCAGISGDDATKPAQAGTTNEPDSDAHNKITNSDCRTKQRRLTRRSARVRGR